MVSVEARELTWLTKKERKNVTTNVVDMMPDILILDLGRLDSKRV
jgi:hypothetical protein